MNKIVRVAPLLLLISCASVQSNPMEVNGKQRHQLSCSEFNNGIERCQAKAKELCVNDYQLVSHAKEVYPDSGDGFYMHANHHMTIECKS